MLPAVQVDEAGFVAARILGAIAGLLIPLVIFIHGYRQISEPDNSRKCAFALTLVGGGWFLSSLAYALSLMMEKSGCARMLAGIITMITLLAGGTLAVRGLLEVAASRRKGPPFRGKGQAIGALIISGLFLVGVTLVVAVGNAMGPDVPAAWKVPQQPPGTRLTSESKKFSLAVPPQGWVQVDPRRLNAMADLAFVKPKGEIFFIAIAHPLPVGSNITNDRLLEVTRGDHLKMDSGARFGEPRAEGVGSAAGVTMTAETTVKETPLDYRYWVYTNGTLAYQFVMWSSRGSSKQLAAELGGILKGLEIKGP